MTVSHPLIEPQHLRELAQVLAETGLAEVEIEGPELRVRLSRQVAGAVAAAPAVAVAAGAAPAGAVAAPVVPAPVADTGVTVRSPLVGTAYGASSPQEAPFIEVGAAVTEGQTLLVVEAMKTLNHVVSPCAGVVREILFRDGEPVEYDQAVVLIDQGVGAMFRKILIANRGEIAVRIISACREMGIATVAVYSTADRDALHVRLADESVCIGGPASRHSYLDMRQIIAACEVTGAEAVHPGYGFLSENARFAELLEQQGIVFIGPTAEHIRIMGDKIAAKKTAVALGIPVVPGSDGAVTEDAEALALAERIGYPVIVKAAAGGGGRGMKVAHSADDMRQALSSARGEAASAFGDDAVYIEKYLQQPRHIEVQVLGDGAGHAIHLGERDCSLQRRHQKVWEEAPSPALDAAQRASIGDTVARAMCGLRYRGAGTVEFLYADGEFYFIEMNTRLQVEHPVTEWITGVDLVREQIRVAAGLGLALRQEDVRLTGHAIECRINAEDPETFAPVPGKLSQFRAPGGPGVRVDSAAYAGYVIPPYYDSLLGKLIVHGADRQQCLERLARALGEFIIEGTPSTLPLLIRLAAADAIRAGTYDIHWLERFLADSMQPA